MALAVPVIQNARAVLEGGCSVTSDCQLISSTVQTMAPPESKATLAVPQTEEWQQVILTFLYINIHTHGNLIVSSDISLSQLRAIFFSFY